MQPEKLDLSTASISEEKLAQLRDLLPEVFHEGKINFDELRNALGDYVEEDPANERFGLRWPGKSRLQQLINTPSVGTLVPQPEESEDWDTTGNIIIEGDNLEVLKLLQKSYASKVKMIYIDPPYNTGNDFVYPDKYASGIDTYLEFTEQTDEDGKKLASNSDTSGRYHANWLNMMYPRLYLSRNLLERGGVIFVSIDDSEAHDLRQVMDQVLGAENFVSQFVWHSSTGGGIRSKFVNQSHQYVMCYARDRDFLPQFWAPLSQEAIKQYNQQDSKGRFRDKDFAWRNPSTNPNQIYMIKAPDGEELLPKQGYIYRFIEERFKSELAEGNVTFKRSDKGPFRQSNGEQANWNIYIKKYLDDGQGAPTSVLPRSLVGINNEGTSEVQNLLDGRIFDNPKNVRLLKYLLEVGAPDDGIVIDFFAGSGSTGHAVMQQNADDSGDRKYIMVQLPEPMESKTLEDGTELNTIADITRERVRRAGKKIAGENPDKDLDIGFRAYKLAPSNFQPWDGTPADSGLMQSARQQSFFPQKPKAEQLSLEQRILNAADHLNPEANDLALLTELLLKVGEELTVPVEELTLAGKTVFAIDGNVRLVCLDREIRLDVIREMAAREPGEIICLDAGFPDDQTKVNAGQIIATQSQNIEGAIAFKVV